MIAVVPENITTRLQLGQFGEDYVRATLRDAGYDVIVPRKGNGGDLLACGLRIEVKTAYQNRDGKYRFCLCKDDDCGKTDHRKSDVIILLCCSSAGLITSFVLPVVVLENKSHISLTRKRGGHSKYNEYRKPILTGLKRWMQ